MNSRSNRGRDMRLLLLKEHQAYFSFCLEMLSDFVIESCVENGEKRSRQDVKTECERMLHERLVDSTSEFFLFEKGRTVIGFAEVCLKEECFPDEDLPEMCVKVLSFYIVPQARRQKLGTSFFKLIRAWGRDKKAALLEVEVPTFPIAVNQFISHQGLELVGAGKKNCYRSFI
jgi:GNAT superfamily N-acetyltransferase